MIQTLPRAPTFPLRYGEEDLLVPGMTLDGEVGVQVHLGESRRVGDLEVVGHPQDNVAQVDQYLRLTDVLRLDVVVWAPVARLQWEQQEVHNGFGSLHGSLSQPMAAMNEFCLTIRLPIDFSRQLRQLSEIRHKVV